MFVFVGGPFTTSMCVCTCECICERESMDKRVVGWTG